MLTPKLAPALQEKLANGTITVSVVHDNLFFDSDFLKLTSRKKRETRSTRGLCWSKDKEEREDNTSKYSAQQTRDSRLPGADTFCPNS